MVSDGLKLWLRKKRRPIRGEILIGPGRTDQRLRGKANVTDQVQ